MNVFSRSLLESLLLPSLAAQFFLMSLVYFSIVRKRISSTFGLFVCYLVVFVLFLVGRPVQYYSSEPAAHYVLYARMFLLLAAGIPSLLAGTLIQCGIKHPRRICVGAYVAGLLFAFSYVFLFDVTHNQLFFYKSMLGGLSSKVYWGIHYWVQGGSAIILLVLPSLYLIIREFCFCRGGRQTAFLFSAFLFGVFMLIASFSRSLTGLIYFGAALNALYWGAVVLSDIREMKSRVSVLKDDIQLLVQSGEGVSVARVEKLLGDLADFSGDNIDLYKMRVCEILNRLTDVTIEAGGDAKHLIKRNYEQLQALDASHDRSSIHEMARKEMVELSGLIVELPRKKNIVVKRAESFLKENFCGDLGIDHLAEKLGVSRSHLMREFKRENGITINQYLTQLRVEHAKNLLKDHNVTETAFEAGFNDPNYFSTVFKKKTGMTPLQYKGTLCEPQAE